MGWAFLALELGALLIDRYPDLEARLSRLRGYVERGEDPPAQEFLDVLQAINANSARIQAAAQALGVLS